MRTFWPVLRTWSIYLIHGREDAESDVVAEIDIRETRAQAAAAGGGTSAAVTYTVKSGDTLSKISKEHYGSANEFMRIFYANRDTLKDPDMIQVGQKLVIPPDDDK